LCCTSHRAFNSGVKELKPLASRLALDVTQPPVQWVLAVLPAGILVVVVVVVVH